MGSCWVGSVLLLRAGLAEGKRIGFNAGVEERDLKGVLGDGTMLADELVQPRFEDGAVAIAVKVSAIGSARRVPVEEYLESVPGPMTRLRSRA